MVSLSDQMQGKTGHVCIKVCSSQCHSWFVQKILKVCFGLVKLWQITFSSPNCQTFFPHHWLTLHGSSYCTLVTMYNSSHAFQLPLITKYNSIIYHHASSVQYSTCKSNHVRSTKKLLQCHTTTVIHPFHRQNIFVLTPIAKIMEIVCEYIFHIINNTCHNQCCTQCLYPFVHNKIFLLKI